MVQCQNYREAHNIHGDDQVRFDKRKQNQGADAKKYGPQTEKVHHNETNTKQTNANPYTFNNSQSSGAGGQYKPKSGCFVCGSLNHKAFECPQRSNPQDQNRKEQGKQQQWQHHVAACQVVEEEYENEWNERTVNIPGIGNVPVIAAVSDSRSEKRQITNKRNKHTSFGEVNNVRVELLRDSGSSVSVLRSALVAPEQYTGKQFTCLLVDNCVKNCPQAVVEVDTKYYKGRLPVVCMERCIYDLIIIGNDIYKHGSERYEVVTCTA